LRLKWMSGVLIADADGVEDLGRFLGKGCVIGDNIHIQHGIYRTVFVLFDLAYTEVDAVRCATQSVIQRSA
jgi:hypothetical protein